MDKESTMKVDIFVGVTTRPWNRDAFRVVTVVIIIVVMVIAAKAGIPVPDVIGLSAAAAGTAGIRAALPPAGGRL
jgi:hypothetical protein